MPGNQVTIIVNDNGTISSTIQNLNLLKQKVDELNKAKVTVKVDTAKTKAASSSAWELATSLEKVQNASRNANTQITATTKSISKKASAQKTASAATKETVAAEKTLIDATEKTANATDKAAQSWANFSTLLKYRAVHVVISQITKAFREAFNMMRDVDDQLVIVRKVSDATVEQMKAIEDQAYKTASAYGIAADQFLESVAAFTRAGYREDASALAELSTKTQLVGDTTAEVADQFLLSVDKAYKFQGSIEELSKVLDGANEIDNKYATSIEKLASGMGIVAPVAAQMNVGIDELAASIGTITAVTQRSGTEAARALRAIFLNIVGDTKTEIDEGVTWTTGEIAGLRDVIRQYAPDAYAAAQALGTIIDPMEAIAGLSKSMKDGLLTEQELVDMVSDIGGKLRSSQLLALIENYDMYESMLKDYANAFGSADREVENALDSWSRKIEILKNTWAEAVATTLDSDFLKGLIDALTYIIDMTGDLGTLLEIVGLITFAIKSQDIFAFVGSGITKVKGFLSELIAGLTTATVQQEAYNVAMTESVALSEMWASALSGVAIVLAGVVIGVRAWEKYVKETLAEQGTIDEEMVSAYSLYKEMTDARNGLLKEGVPEDKAKDAFYGMAEAMGYTADQADILLKRYGNLEDASGRLTNEALKAAQRLEMESEQTWKKNLANYIGPGRQARLAETSSGKPLVVTNPTGKLFATKEDHATYDTSSLYAYTDGMSDFTKEMVAFVRREYNTLDDVKEVYDYYRHLIELRDRLENEAAGVYGNEPNPDILNSTIYRQTIDDLEELEPLISEYGDHLSASRQIAAMLAASQEELNTSWAAARNLLADEDIKTYADALFDLGESYYEVERAYDAYQKKLEGGERGDALKTYSELYDTFLKHYQAGEFGSREYQGIIDMLLPDSVKEELDYDYEALGEKLAGSFYRGLYAEGGEDKGLAFFEALEKKANETGDVVDEATGKVVASITDLGNGNANLVIEDFDALAESLGMSLPALMAEIDALAIFDSGIVDTSHALFTLADRMGVLTEEANGMMKLDLGTFVRKLALEGVDEGRIHTIVSELADAENIDFSTIDTSGIVDIKEYMEDAEGSATDLANVDLHGLINAYIDTKEAAQDANKEATELGDKEAKPTVELDHTVFDAQVKIANDKLDRLNNRRVTPTISMTTIGMTTSAEGTDSAPGGPTLVNEEGPELIKEGNRARIAGGGAITVTYLQPGAQVFTAEETADILRGNMFAGDEIPAFSDGASLNIRRRTSTGSGTTTVAKRTGASNSSAKSSAGTKKSTDKDEQLEKHKAIVALLESELELLEAQDKPVRDQVAKAKEIQNALLDQINYMKSIGAEQADINKLYVEWYNWNDKIAKLQKQIYEDLDDAIDNELDEIKKFYDDQKDAIDEQIDALKEARDAKEDELDLDEKLLAVEEARAKLANAQAERTVRMYNAQTGQWEWVANAKNVQSAQEALQKAEEDLAKYYEDAAYDAQVAALEAQKDALDDEFDSIKEKWQEILDALEEPAKTLEEVLAEIARDATDDMIDEISALNRMLAEFGYSIPMKGATTVYQTSAKKYDSGGVLSGLGGIKATPLAEGVLPPDLTAAMLSPQSNEVFAQRLSELRYLYGANGMPTMLSGGGSRIGSQHNGNVYTFGNITLSEAQARSTTVYELAQRSRNLALYRNVN